jgi:hypothetical protein
MPLGLVYQYSYSLHELTYYFFFLHALCLFQSLLSDVFGFQFYSIVNIFVCRNIDIVSKLFIGRLIVSERQIRSRKISRDLSYSPFEMLVDQYNHSFLTFLHLSDHSLTIEACAYEELVVAAFVSLLQLPCGI